MGENGRGKRKGAWPLSHKILDAPLLLPTGSAKSTRKMTNEHQQQNKTANNGQRTAQFCQLIGDETHCFSITAHRTYRRITALRVYNYEREWSCFLAAAAAAAPTIRNDLHRTLNLCQLPSPVPERCADGGLDVSQTKIR